jgi:hypothetical protein
LTTPADLAGITVRAPRSDTTYALFEALGATPDDPSGDPFEEAVAAGSVAAAESSFALTASLPAPTTATGNVTLYPKVNSLVINSDTLDDLSDDQRETLRDAAAATRDWAVTNTPSDADMAQEHCAGAGRIVAATDADIAAFERAALPVYDELERVETTAALIERIRELKDQSPAVAPVAPCEPGAVPTGPVEGDDPDLAAFPEGVYRIEITDDDLRTYFPAITDHELRDNRGVWTWTLADGQYTAELRGSVDTLDGTYEVAGDRVTFIFNEDDAQGLPLTFVWHFDDGSLRLELVGETHPVLEAYFTAHPWTRVADAD